jgi:hypothetical protein
MLFHFVQITQTNNQVIQKVHFKGYFFNFLDFKVTFHCKSKKKCLLFIFSHLEFGIYVFQKRVVSFSLRKIQFQNELAFIPSKKGVLMELLLWYLPNHSIVQLNVFFYVIISLLLKRPIVERHKELL